MIPTNLKNAHLIEDAAKSSTQERMNFDDKIKQLKNFIYMVDLYNVMEHQQKKEMSYSPGKGEANRQGLHQDIHA